MLPWPTVRRLTLIACLALSGCSWLMNPPQVRGNKIDPDQMKELTPGVSTKADVTAVIGSPTAHDSFDDNIWLYISELTQSRIGRTLGELKQDVVVMTFDQGGVLQKVEEKDKSDALPVTVVRRDHALSWYRSLVPAAASRQYRPLQPWRCPWLHRRGSYGRTPGGAPGGSAGQ